MYTPDIDFHGNDTIIIDVDDLGFTGSGGIKMHTMTINVVIQPMEDLLTLDCPMHAITGTEDTSPPTSEFSNVSVLDPDGLTWINQIWASIHLVHGDTSIERTSAQAYDIQYEAVFSDFTANIDATLSSINYLPPLDYNYQCCGVEFMILKVSRYSDFRTYSSCEIQIHISPVNDVPTILQTPK